MLHVDLAIHHRVLLIMFFATFSYFHSNADPMLFQHPPLQPISTSHKVPCSSVPAHAVLSPTTVCNSFRRDDAIELAVLNVHFSPLSQLSLTPPRHFSKHNSTTKLQRLGRRRHLPVPIPMQTFLLIPAVPV